MTYEEYKLVQRVRTILARLKKAGRINDYTISPSERMVGIKFEPKPFWRLYTIASFLKKYRKESLEYQDEYKVHRPRRPVRNR